jgi:hypothetical protein
VDILVRKLGTTLGPVRNPIASVTVAARLAVADPDFWSISDARTGRRRTLCSDQRQDALL